MTPYQLKRDILYSAIQGKITKREFSEGTGLELLKINASKRQTILSDEKIKSGKPCKTINEDDYLFDIPENWAWERFGNLVVNLDSKRKPVTKEDRKTTKGLYDYYGATGAIDKVDEYIFDGEYLMIGEDGGNFFVDRDNSFIANGKFWANNHVHVVKPVVCDIHYLKDCLDAYSLPNMGLINGIAVPKLNQENLNSIMIPVPPLAEQKRIVAKIEELLPLIDRYEEAWTKLEVFNKRFPDDMQKSLLQMAIQGKLVEQRFEEGTGEELFQRILTEKARLIKEGKIKKGKPLPEISDDEKPFDIPKNWKWVRWGALSESIQYGFNAPAKDKGRIRMVRISDIQNGNVLWDTVPFCDIAENDIETYLLRKNDILFARTGGTVGKSFLVKEVPYESVYAGYLIRTRYSSLLCPEYMKHFMESQLYWEQLRNGTIATAQPNCNGQTLSKMILPLPPIAEQKRIVSKLEELLPLSERLK